LLLLDFPSLDFEDFPSLADLLLSGLDDLDDWRKQQQRGQMNIKY
jgi:hypothetical protein